MSYTQLCSRCYYYAVTHSYSSCSFLCVLGLLCTHYVALVSRHLTYHGVVFLALNEIRKCYSHLVRVVSNSPYLEVCMFSQLVYLNISVMSPDAHFGPN